jgi:hypothetical protein
VGDSVWIYEPPCAPKEGTVSQLLDYGVRVETDDRTARNRVYAKHQLFHRPFEVVFLAAQMQDDADTLLRHARKLEDDNELN